MLSLLLLYFNPLHHEGGDCLGTLTFMMLEVISIHSTTRVETSTIPQARGHLCISIHSTTRVETLRTFTVLNSLAYFNPLHHEGGDILLPGRAERERYISIHSTTRVETSPGPFFKEVRHISIHSTTRVETAILHNNHYYSSTHFHKQIISHPLKSRPTIPAHSQIRSHCANFPVRISP